MLVQMRQILFSFISFPIQAFDIHQIEMGENGEKKLQMIFPHFSCSTTRS